MNKITDLPNDLWQCDIMYGPVLDNQGKKKKSYLIAFMDDYSRLITHGRFYLSANLGTTLEAFEQAFIEWGLPRIVFVDNGAVFSSRHLERCTTSLGIALIHSKPFEYVGKKKKIETFFYTIKQKFLPNYAGRTLADLNQAFSDWLNIYHHQRRSDTGQTPLDRFTANSKCLRKPPINLKDHFRCHARRRVAKDCTITLDGNPYEVPIALINQYVDLYYPIKNSNRMEIRYGQKSYGFAKPIEIGANCQAKKDKNNCTEISIKQNPQQYQGGHLWPKK